MKVILSTPPRDGIVIVDGESTQRLIFREYTILQPLQWVLDALEHCETYNGKPLVEFQVLCETDGCRGGEIQYPEWEGLTETCPDCHGGLVVHEFADDSVVTIGFNAQFAVLVEQVKP